jgi:transcriptional regulator with XRE-family HTH domain
MLKLRTGLKFTQYDFAAYLEDEGVKCSQGDISRWERGAVTPLPQKLLDIARVCCVEVGTLVPKNLV